MIPIAALRFVPALGNSDLRISDVGVSPVMRLADALSKEGLRWGYATWWNAGAVTVLSDGAVRANPIIIVGSILSPYHSMVQQDWYAPVHSPEQSFLALDRSETTARQLEALNHSLGRPLREIDTADDKILVYARNIANDFVCSHRSELDHPLEADPVPGRVHAVTYRGTEPPRDSWRLQLLREWSDDQVER
jgi:hypothetical protein